MQRSQGESTGPEASDQERDQILERFREHRVLRPIARVRAWSRPPITGFDPSKAKRAYDAFQRVRSAKDNPPLRKLRVEEFHELLTEFLA